MRRILPFVLAFGSGCSNVIFEGRCWGSHPVGGLFSSFDREPGSDRFVDFECFWFGDSEPEPLDEWSLGSLEIPDGTVTETRRGDGAHLSSGHDLSAWRALDLEPDRTCLESDSVRWARRAFLEGEDCWADGSCDRLEAVTEVREENGYFDVWYDRHQSWQTFRYIDAGHRLRTGVVSRSWTEEVFDARLRGGPARLSYRFGLELWMPDPARPERTRRWSAVWLDVVPDEPPEAPDGWYSLLPTLVENGLAHQEAFLDEGEVRECGRERGAEPPPRP